MGNGKAPERSSIRLQFVFQAVPQVNRKNRIRTENKRQYAENSMTGMIMLEWKEGILIGT